MTPIFILAIICLLVMLPTAAVGYGVPADLALTEFARHCFLFSASGFTAAALAVIAGLDDVRPPIMSHLWPVPQRITPPQPCPPHSDDTTA